LELNRLPGLTRELAELGRFSSTSDATMSTEGLPGRLAGTVVDGIQYRSAVHDGLPSPDSPTIPFAFSSLEAVELASNRVDVEYSGLAGASLVGFSRRGTREMQIGFFGDWSGATLSSSDYFDPADLSYHSVRGGISASGPVIRDTSQFFIAVEGRRLRTPMPSAWAPTPFDSALVAVAADSFGVDLTGYTSPGLTQTDALSGYARFDWQFGERDALTLRANVAMYETDNPDLGARRISDGGVTREGTDLSGLAALTSSFSRVFGLEQRIGFEYSRRQHSEGLIAASAFSGAPAILGTDPVLPAGFSRLAFRANETLHLGLRAHSLKLGASAALSSTEREYWAGRYGAFVFSDVSSFAALDGLFVQAVGQPPTVKYTTLEFGGYLQDTWTVIPGLEITGGVRVDIELLPDDEVPLNTAWLALTGLANGSYDRTIIKVSPRLGLFTDRGTWQVRVDATVHHGTVTSEAFGELATDAGSMEMRRGLGPLGSWPNSPSSAVAPGLGPTLTLLGPDFQPPRSARASADFTADLGGGVRFDLSGVYRHTDFLPRRHDLNLVNATSASDQFGRPMYGEIVKRGGLIGAVPGSNRRFTEFDVVSALDPDGYSDYWGVTAGVERRFGGFLNIFASYTYSETQDNWLSGLGGEPSFQLTPFADSLDWADGRSDFDVPHRLTVGAELDFGALRVAGFFRGQSGTPFTPGFQYGVDANGDGSYLNDPAFVDDQIAGIPELFNDWECLRGQVGQFAERNSCRGAPFKTLDLRLTATPVRVGSYPISVVVDGLNLLDPDLTDLDNALYLVDPIGSIDFDAASSELTIPLEANANFGRPVIRRSTGRSLRVGLRVNYE
jgi:hypothetical protein